MLLNCDAANQLDFSEPIGGVQVSRDSQGTEWGEREGGRGSLSCNSAQNMGSIQDSGDTSTHPSLRVDPNPNPNPTLTPTQPQPKP